MAADVPPFGRQEFVSPRARLEPIDGGWLMTSPVPLPDPPRTVVDYLRRSASRWPDRLMLADRVTSPEWRRISYRDALEQVNSVAQAMLDRDIGRGDVVAIIGPNSIDQAVIMFGALTAGAAVAPISLAYAMFPEARARLFSTFAKAHPKMLFVQDAVSLAPALAELDLAGAELVSVTDFADATPFGDLTGATAGDDVERAYNAIEPDWTGKILFTSGSTGTPKGVINTHRMMTSNLEMMASVRMADPAQPSILLDWLPWHHTFGGNVVLAEAIADGAALYIDDGKPVPGPMLERTIAAIKEIHPTMYNCVPAGLAMLANAMDTDTELRDAMFDRLNLLRYGGAGLSGKVYEKLQQHCEAATGKRVPAVTAYAMTEASPGATVLHWPYDGSDCSGVPLPGVEMKLLEVTEGRFEIRLRGPNVFPGYLEEPAVTAGAFDDEGFFRTGDVCRLLEPANPAAGIAYDGRISEDFKLDTGTWVNVGQIRADLLESFGPLLRDAVITGDRRPFVGAMAWLQAVPEDAQCRDGVLIPGVELRALLQGRLDAWNERNKASSRRIERLVLLAEPARQEHGEINDKQYVNQRAVLELRSQIVDRLYGEPDDACIVKSR